MPDLEQQISEWRKEMLAVRISPDDVAELESHLRDDFDEQLRSNREAEPDFSAAVRRLGAAPKLRAEFRKTKSLFQAAQKTLFTFAGIPNHYVQMNAPSPNLDSRWVTYLRSALFLLPAVCLWMLAATYVVPQFHALWNKASIYNAADFANYLRFDLAVMSLFKDNFFFITCFTLVALGLLEWRFRPWPRYRRAVFGAVVFLVNLTILLSFVIVFIGATLVATQFATHAAK